MVGPEAAAADPLPPKTAEGRAEAGVMIAVGVQPPRPRRVLIIKPSALGDVVTALPVLRGLRRTFGEARIAWLVQNTYAPLVAHDGDLDEVISYDRRRLGRFWRSASGARHVLGLRAELRKRRFDWAIDLQGLARSGYFSKWTRAALRAGFRDAREFAPRHYTHAIPVEGPHTVDRNIQLARELGIDARCSDMRLQVASEAERFAAEFLTRRHLKGGDFLVCVPPTRWPTKWYPLRHWRSVVREMVHRLPVVVLGTGADIDFCRAVADGAGRGLINMAGKTSIPQFVGLIARSAGVVCSDSAAKFIAQAVGVSVVVLIGPTRAEETGPYSKVSPPGKAIVSDVPCQGCLRKRCRHVTCMQVIEPRRVVAAVMDTLEAGGN
jgi:ADP-heptose:LPS heptosyltransferase